MGELEQLMRLQVQADKEFVTKKLNTYGAPALFVTSLTGGHTRKQLVAYNNSDAGSGEICWGGSDCDTNGMFIPKGSQVDIPIADALAEDGVTGGVDVYFCNELSGELGDLRVLEIA